jgi:hypothetical protein
MIGTFERNFRENYKEFVGNARGLLIEKALRIVKKSKKSLRDSKKSR